MKLPIFLALLVFLMGTSVALGDEVSSTQSADSRSEMHKAEKLQDFDEERLDAELLAYEKRYEAEKTRKEGRKVKNTILLSFIWIGVLLFIAKWVSLGGRKEWSVPNVFWALLGFIGATYLGVAVRYDMTLGRVGVSSKAGVSVVSLDREPFLFYLAISVKVALAAILLWVSLRKVFRKGK